MIKNTYLVKALRAFRIRTEGQFGEITERVVQETQDAADEIDRLNFELERLNGGIEISLDNNRHTSGIVSQLSWARIGKVLEHDDGGRYKIVGFKASEDGLSIYWENLK